MLAPFLFTVLVAAPLVAGQTTRTLTGELSATGPFAVENLAGHMRIVAGAADAVTVAATVHSDDPELASQVRLEKSNGEGDVPTLRIVYPLDHHARICYPDPRVHEGIGWFDLFEGSRVEYDGHLVRVTQHHGPILYADVEVRVPQRDLDGQFRNLIGFVEARGARGRLGFEVQSADLRLEELRGDINLTGTSGDFQASEIRGSWSSTFTSGDGRVEDFDVSTATFSSTSGDVHAHGLKASRLVFEANSGDARFSNADVQDFNASATSGDVELDNSGGRLTKVGARTGSGDVLLRLPSDASFEASLRHGSGDVNVGFTDAYGAFSGRRITGYRRGSGGIQIDVRTGSGDISIEPR